MTTKGLLLAASIAMAAPGNAQVASPPPDAPAGSASGPAKPEKTVQGATPGRVAQIERCQGHKFESVIVIDPAKKHTTRVKLCANPGSSDADWVKTLQAAIAQIEQRDMPPAAKEKVISALNSELAKFTPASQPVAITQGAPLMLGGVTSATLIPPTERYETSILPPLPPRKVAANASSAPALSRAVRPVRIDLKCLDRGQAGPGATCTYFEPDTILAIRAVEGLEVGGTLRFRRRGQAQGEVALAPMRAGQSTRVRLPGALCQGVVHTKVEIELLEPKSASAVSARLGPYDVHC